MWFKPQRKDRSSQTSQTIILHKMEQIFSMWWNAVRWYLHPMTTTNWVVVGGVAEWNSIHVWKFYPNHISTHKPNPTHKLSPKSEGNTDVVEPNPVFKHKLYINCKLVPKIWLVVWALIQEHVVLGTIRFTCSLITVACYCTMLNPQPCCSWTCS